MPANTSDEANAHTARVRSTTPAAAQRIRWLCDGMARNASAPIRYDTDAESGKSVPQAVRITGQVITTAAAVMPAAIPDSRRMSR